MSPDESWKAPCLLMLLLILSSCIPGMTRFRLERAEALMEDRPDSALSVLRTVDTATLKTRAARARYALLLAASLDKNYIDTTDTRILRPALDYYGRRKDDAALLRAWYYLGRSTTLQGRSPC